MKVCIERLIRLAWLDRTLGRLSANHNLVDFRPEMEAVIRAEFGPAVAHKAAGQVLRLWSSLNGMGLLKDRAIALARDFPGDHLALHWGQLLSHYPFARGAARAVGRLFKLYEEVSLLDVHSRLISAWGDRPYVRRATFAVLATFADWGVIRGHGLGHSHRYRARQAVTPAAPVQLWLLETLLRATPVEGRMGFPLDAFLAQPEAFPFRFTVTGYDLRHSGRFELFREGDVEKVAFAS